MENNAFANEMAKAGVRQTTIDGTTYSIKVLPASIGLRIGNKLIKGLAPAIGTLVDNLDSEGVFPEEQTMFTDIAVALVRQMDEMNIEEIIGAVLNGLSVGSKSVDFDNHFAGNYGELIAVVEFALKENFGSFFTDYLKAKGLEIPILREMMTRKAEKASSSEKE